MAKPSLTVTVLHSVWSYEDHALVQGEHELDHVSDDLLHALGAAEEAGAVRLDGAKEVLAKARSDVETAEAAMKVQDDRLAKTDPEHLIVHLAWEAERRIDQAKELLDEAAAATIDDTVTDSIRERVARLVSQAEGIAGRMDELVPGSSADTWKLIAAVPAEETA